MQLKLIKTLWGLTEGATTREDLARIKAAGFAGIEWFPPQMEPERWKALCGELKLDYVVKIRADTPRAFERAASHACAYGPLLIVACDGHPQMTLDEGGAYFKAALAVERDLGVPVAHQTHRAGLLNTPWNTARYLERLRDLMLCADFSHWCCACESLLEEYTSWLETACTRTIHIHGRVGWEQGSQVPDPRAPEYRPALQSHEQWWDLVFETRRKAFADWLTFNPEFGPPPYMPTQPHTQQPVANLWDVHLWMAQRAKSRWQR
ncbi:MAG: sugar phosphate isomerase/epimerase [Phycisphaerae bacterium]|nr:sugar phosphate isomerase/epimerase [Phycisphaerae bacterium]